MILELHPEMRVRKVTIGAERQPLLVIDDFVNEPERLVRKAASRRFAQLPGYFPGLRTEAPLSYQALLAERLKPLLLEYFGLVGRSFKFSLCHYSLVTTPADQLAALQRIPHFDSVDPTGLATVHYLFKGALEVKSRSITHGMMVAAARTIAANAEPGEVVPSPLNKGVHRAVANAVAEAARAEGLEGTAKVTRRKTA